MDTPVEAGMRRARKTDARLKGRTWIRKAATPAIVLASLAMASACGSAPFESGSATSTIRFVLSGATTSAGIPVCDETDLAQIGVTPDGRSSQSKDRGIQRGEDCGVEFTVTVPKGTVNFSGRLVGGGRTLMRGGRGDYPVREDGFVVHIDLEEVKALGIETRTIGLGGPAEYWYEIAGSDEHFPIGLDDADTLSALAGGPRNVVLHTAPCVVVNGPADRDVMIPRPDTEVGGTMFEIDCNQGGDVDIVITTKGGGPTPPYTAHIGDEPPHPGTQDSMRVSGVTPGPIDVGIDIPGGSCVVGEVTEGPYFLPSGGHVRVEFIVQCSSGGGGAPGGPGGPGGPGTPGPTSAPDTIRVVTQISQPPLPGEVETFDATVTGATSASQTLAVGVADSVSFLVPKGDYPFAVGLAPTGTCVVKNGVGVQSVVSASSTGLTRVVFDVGC